MQCKNSNLAFSTLHAPRPKDLWHGIQQKIDHMFSLLFLCVISSMELTLNVWSFAFLIFILHSSLELLYYHMGCHV